MNEQEPNQPTGDNLPDDESDNNDHAMAHQTATTDVSEDAKAALKMFGADAPQKSFPEGHLVEGDVMLQVSVKGAETPVMLALREEMVIGRRDPNGEIIPDLDLTVYGAYQLGVSRRHAVIRTVERRLNLFDLGSRNGTYLNGYRLSPHQPAPLRDGDEIRVGKIAMTIKLKAK